MATTANNTRRIIEVDASHLPLHCPLPEHALWNAHPRVFLPIEKTGEAVCPYCGTHYKLQSGPLAGRERRT